MSNGENKRVVKTYKREKVKTQFEMGRRIERTAILRLTLLSL